MIERRGKPAHLYHNHTRHEREQAAEALEAALDLPVEHHDDDSATVAEAEATTGPRSWRRVLVLSTMIGVGIGGALAAVLHYVDGPSEGQVKTLAVAEASVAPKPSLAPVNTLSGLYVTLQYPGSFTDLQRVKDGANDLEDYLMNTKSTLRAPRTTLAVEVLPLPVAGIKDDPSYRLRALRPDVYTARAVTVGGETATLMVKADGTEQTLFWAHGRNELTVAIGCNQAGNETVGAAMKQVLATARWRS